MVGTTAAAIAGGSNIGSALLSSKSAKSSVKKQIAWERERAQNAHQWEVADLQAAGINTALTAGGNGANTGSIGDSSYDYANTAKGIAEATQIGLNAKQTEADVNLKKASTAKEIAETDFTKGAKTAEAKERANLAKQEALLTTAETLTESERRHNVYENTQLTGWQKERIQREIKALDKQLKYMDAKEIAEIVKSGTESFDNIIDSVGKLKMKNGGNRSRRRR